MLQLNTPIKLNELVAATLGWSLIEVTVTHIHGLEYQGNLVLMKRPEGSRERYTWFAKYRGDDRWNIGGPGAKVGSGGTRVPDADKFPFVLDGSVNEGVRKALTSLFNKNKSTRSLSESGAPPPAAPAKIVQPPPPPPKPALPKLSRPEPAPSKPAPQKPIPPPVPAPAPATAPKAIVPPKPVILAKPVEAPPPAHKPAEKPSTGLAPGVILISPEKPASLSNELWADPKEIVQFQPQENDPSFTGQPRKWFDPVELKKLGTSMKEFEQQDAITVIAYNGPIPGKKWELVNGERRWRSALAENLPLVKISVGKQVDKKTQHLRALIQNFCKAGHTNRELSDSFQEQIDAGMTIAKLADAVGLKPAFITRMLSLQRLHPDLKALLDPPVPKKDRIRVNEGQVL